MTTIRYTASMLSGALLVAGLLSTGPAAADRDSTVPEWLRPPGSCLKTMNYDNMTDRQFTAFVFHGPSAIELRSGEEGRLHTVCLNALDYDNMRDELIRQFVIRG